MNDDVGGLLEVHKVPPSFSLDEHQEHIKLPSGHHIAFLPFQSNLCTYLKLSPVSVISLVLIAARLFVLEI
jgi:hypothetical protein